MALVSSADLAEWIGNISGSDGVTLLAKAEDDVVQWLETQTGRRLRHQAARVEILDGNGITGPLLLPGPITDDYLDLTLETRGATDDDWTLIDADTVELQWDDDYQTHQVWLTQDYFPHGRRLVRTTYQTGYGTGAGEATAPGDIELAVKELVALHWQGRFKSVDIRKSQAAEELLDKRMQRFVLPVVHRYRNPYRGKSELDRIVI